LTIVLSLKLSEFLEISDPLVSETGPSGFAELGLAEQISVDYISKKPEHPVWQTGMSSFSRM
jgi:hypothetical protein